MFVPYIIGAVLLGVSVFVMVLRHSASERFIRKTISPYRFNHIESAKYTGVSKLTSYRVKQPLIDYGMGTHANGLQIECVVVKSGDSRLKKGEIGLEIFIRESAGSSTIGASYFRKFREDKIDLLFSENHVKGFPKHLAQIIIRHKPKKLI